jgi:type II secretory pathway pseudopilin PulG
MGIGLIEILVLLPILLLLATAWAFRLSRMSQKRRQLHRAPGAESQTPRRPVLGLDEPNPPPPQS